jgi:PhnB protein
MKSITPQIYVVNCKEALEYYKGVFGGEIQNVQLADGIPMFKGQEGKIIHSELHINESCILYLVDVLDGSGKGSESDLVLEMDSEEEINRVYSALKEKGSVQYELQKTFWGAYHAVVVDCYGNKWGLNYTVK